MQSCSRFCLLLLSLFALLLTACGGGNNDDGGGAARSSQPGSLQFGAGSVSVDENAGTATLTVVRSAGSDGAISVTLTTGNGSAIAGQDYTALNTSVNFAAGETAAKTVTLPIADDDQGEAEETFTATLAAPTGGATLGTVATATLTVRDNDSPSLPVLAVRSNIRQLQFSWAAVPGATGYRLLRDPNGASGFTPVGIDLAADATSANMEVAVHKHDWVNARYQLEACNARGCTVSAPTSAMSAMLGAIGYFKASNTEAQDIFGFAVAMSTDGNTLAVGAPREDSNASGVDGDQNNNQLPESGAVYVFTRNGLQWSQQAYLKASDTDTTDAFGSALGLSADGNTLAVGAPSENSGATGVGGDESDGGAFDSGAVYVFTRVGTQWSQQAYVKASNTDPQDGFGSGLALSADGQTLAVGALGEDSDARGVGQAQDNDNARESGAVYVFTRVAELWSQQAYIKASNSQADDLFSSSLAISEDGSTLAVGATGEASNGAAGNQNDNSAPRSGAVYVFTRAAGQWSQQVYVKASYPDAYDGFGTAVSLSGDGNTLAVGAPGEDSGATGIQGDARDDSVQDSGAVYLFSRDGMSWAATFYVKASNTGRDESFGQEVALSAVGGTLAVAAPTEDSNARGIGGAQGNSSADRSGAVYVFDSPDAVVRQAYVKASNTQSGNLFGFSIALSSDGSTLAVGAPIEESGAMGIGGAQSDNSATFAGAVYLY